MSIIDRLKDRWKIQSTKQVIIILIVFACTGFSALYAKEFLFGWIGITKEDPFWYRSIIWIVTILPVYNLLLLVYGFLFGQSEFFWNFFKKTLGRLVPGKGSSRSRVL